jgi:hypothetical protein
MRKIILIIICVFAFIGVGLVLLVRWHFGPYYDPSNSQGLQKLRTLADVSRPLREALERFKDDHGRYPNSTTNLFPLYLRTTNTTDDFTDWQGWRCVELSSNSYELFYQLEWDGGLWFDHSPSGTNQWTWSTSNRAVDLTKVFQQR